MARVHILDQSFDLPELATDRFRSLHLQIQRRQARIRAGTKPRPKLLGLIQRAPAPLSYAERLEELDRLIRDYDAVIDGLKADKERYRTFFQELARGVQRGIVGRCEQVRGMEEERRTLQEAAQQDHDALLLEQTQLTQERLMHAVRMMGQATLLILKKIDLCQQSLHRLTEDQSAQRDVIQRLVVRLHNHRRMQQLQQEVEQFEQDVARMAQTALNFEAHLREYFGPLQELLDQVSRVDSQLHGAVIEIESIARSLSQDQQGEGLHEALQDSDAKLLNFLVSSQLKRDNLVDLLNKLDGEDGAMEAFELELHEAEAQPSVLEAVDNISLLVDTRMPKLRGGLAIAAEPRGNIFELGEHPQPIRGVATTGGLAATAGRDGCARVWDIATGALVHILKGHGDQLLGVTFARHDPSLLITHARDTTIRLWDVGTGACRNVLKGHSDHVLGVALSPDRNLMMSCSRDTTLRLWETTTGRSLYKLRAHTNWVTAVVFLPDGEHVVSGAGDASLRVWRVDKGKLVTTLHGHLKGVETLAVSPDGRWLASGSWDSTVRLWDLETYEPGPMFEGHNSDVRALCFSPDGSLLASGGADAKLLVWDVVTGRCQRTFEEHSKAIDGVAFSSDGRFLMSGGADQRLLLHTL